MKIYTRRLRAFALLGILIIGIILISGCIEQEEQKETPEPKPSSAPETEEEKAFEQEPSPAPETEEEKVFEQELSPAPETEEKEKAPEQEPLPSPEEEEKAPGPAPEGEIKEFEMTAKRFSFEPNIITVNKGDTVKLKITSVDVTHGFAINEFNVNEKLEPKETVSVEFVADKTGTFTFYCSIFCGSGHREMKGTLVVQDISSTKKSTYTNVNAEEFKKLVDDEETFVLDVHIPEQKHIKGTDAFIPYNRIPENLNKLPEDKETIIAVYCRSDPMSTQAAEEIVELGYIRVYNLIGGVNAWKAEGYEME